MRSMVRRVIGFLGRYFLLILVLLIFLAIAVVLWRCSAWLRAAFAGVPEDLMPIVIALIGSFTVMVLLWILYKTSVNWIRYKEKVEVLKNIVEVIAIIFAAVWTFYIFGLKDKPGLEFRANIASELIWNEVSGTEICEAEFKVIFQNIGVTTFNISKVYVYGWEFPEIMLESTEFFKYLDVNIIRREVPTFFDKTYDNRSIQEDISWVPFIGDYSPGATWQHSFQFVIKRLPKTWVLFMLRVFDNNDILKDQTYQWELICGSGKGGREQPSDNLQ